ncbi:outer membrane protein/peptidoglycan-associated (lipo)protein [Beggiatoa alba B18LD]|uniref:Outer membrane protein/peptidoglycan-associated (Lipo)protein n=1 Tax=Beggiatoa alba B18LD TaxID=395493 RepID=I3CH70_9GAMM|nr:OmpA family protein [Beggiatoa alba]EIJ42963.1 outer membrane protein/peptidoglycan-associated (lipo)protein [Beggiatoa alba B18LD]
MKNDRPYFIQDRYHRLFGLLIICAIVQGCSQLHGWFQSNFEALNPRKTDKGLLLVLESVYFMADGTALTPEASRVLDALADTIKNSPDSNIAIDGYTDSSGNATYNLWLSKQRAEQVKQALVQRGIEATRITTEGFGQASPIANNATPEGRQKNRRVEIIILNVIDIPRKKNDMVITI